MWTFLPVWPSIRRLAAVATGCLCNVFIWKRKDGIRRWTLWEEWILSGNQWKSSYSTNNNPICSRYGIFTYICHRFMANVVRIHGAPENGKLRFYKWNSCGHCQSIPVTGCGSVPVMCFQTALTGGGLRTHVGSVGFASQRIWKTCWVWSFPNQQCLIVYV